jgi:PIN domain nuclease of toxin-antitoxin system
MPDREVRRALDGLGLEVQAFDREQAYLAGQLRTGTRSPGLSLGDRACLALGQRLKTVVLTADRQWEAVRAGVDVQVIR